MESELVGSFTRRRYSPYTLDNNDCDPTQVAGEENTMAYAIVINLDYDNHPPAICSELWNVIKLGMLQAGFKCDGRTFTTNQTEKQACARAQKVIDDLEGHLEYHNKHLYRFMKDFYGYDTAATTNLLVPSSIEIDVQIGALN